MNFPFFKIRPASKKQNVKHSHFILLISSLLIIIFLNVVGSYVFGRLDLTSDKRYTLSPVTKNILRGTDDIVFLRCYLEGDLPTDYRRLRNETRDLLNQLRAYNTNIEYEFLNPSEISDPKEQKQFYQLLYEKGFQPLLTSSTSQQKDKMVQQYIFPYIEVSHKGRSAVISLLPADRGSNEESIVNQAIKNLEYSLTGLIRNISIPIKEKVAFLQGHGEWNATYMWDFIGSLSEYYAVDTLSLNEQISVLTDRIYDTTDVAKVSFRNKYKLLIIAKPQSVFSYKDFFILDQFVMRGGRILWLIDPLDVSMDSLQSMSETYAIARPTGVEDHLFRYGVRLNNQLILDWQSAKIPIITGSYNDQTPQFTFYPWHFFPEISPQPSHIISRKISPLRLEIASTMDTVESPVKKTILLTTSVRTRVMNTPAIVSLRMASQPQDRRLYNRSHLPVAILLEGSFPSVFRHRITPEIETSNAIGFIEEGEPSAMIVVSDGDIIRNDFMNGQMLPLGFDRFTGQTYGNKDFLLNCVNYLCGDEALIPLRTREVVLRKLDANKIESQRLAWQLLNTILPVCVILTFGVLFLLYRRKRFAHIGRKQKSKETVNK